eukprot:COSAG02_NODE_6803_length_3351_cov_17.529520_3_plen_146_part_00
MNAGGIAESFASTVCAANCFWWTRRSKGRWRCGRQWVLPTLVDTRPGDVPGTSIVPSKLPTVVNANHFCVEKSVAAEPFHSSRLGVVISTEVENPRARMLIRCAFLFAHSFARVQVRRRWVVSGRNDAEPIRGIKEIFETYERTR